MPRHPPAPRVRRAAPSAPISAPAPPPLRRDRFGVLFGALLLLIAGCVSGDYAPVAPDDVDEPTPQSDTPLLDAQEPLFRLAGTEPASPQPWNLVGFELDPMPPGPLMLEIDGAVLVPIGSVDEGVAWVWPEGLEGRHKLRVLSVFGYSSQLVVEGAPAEPLGRPVEAVLDDTFAALQLQADLFAQGASQLIEAGVVQPEHVADLQTFAQDLTAMASLVPVVAGELDADLRLLLARALSGVGFDRLVSAAAKGGPADDPVASEARGGSPGDPYWAWTAMTATIIMMDDLSMLLTAVGTIITFMDMTLLAVEVMALAGVVTAGVAASIEPVREVLGILGGVITCIDGFIDSFIPTDIVAGTLVVEVAPSLMYLGDEGFARAWAHLAPQMPIANAGLNCGLAFLPGGLPWVQITGSMMTISDTMADSAGQVVDLGIGLEAFAAAMIAVPPPFNPYAAAGPSLLLVAEATREMGLALEDIADNQFPDTISAGERLEEGNSLAGGPVPDLVMSAWLGGGLSPENAADWIGFGPGEGGFPLDITLYCWEKRLLIPGVGNVWSMLDSMGGLLSLFGAAASVLDPIMTVSAALLLPDGSMWSEDGSVASADCVDASIVAQGQGTTQIAAGAITNRPLESELGIVQLAFTWLAFDIPEREEAQVLQAVVRSIPGGADDFEDGEIGDMWAVHQFSTGNRVISQVDEASGRLHMHASAERDGVGVLEEVGLRSVARVDVEGGTAFATLVQPSTQNGRSALAFSDDPSEETSIFDSDGWDAASYAGKANVLAVVYETIGGGLWGLSVYSRLNEVGEQPWGDDDDDDGPEPEGSQWAYLGGIGIESVAHVDVEFDGDFASVWVGGHALIEDEPVFMPDPYLYLVAVSEGEPSRAFVESAGLD